MGKLSNVRVAILATDGFEQSELTSPMSALQTEGADVDVISLSEGSIKGWQGNDWGDTVTVNHTLTQVKAEEYDAIVLPGGLINPDALRVDQKSVDFVRHFVNANKPIGAICHGPWILINADGVKGRRMTSWPSLEVDLKNAGANWVNEEVVVDQGLVTSRKPDDLPAFNTKLVEEIREGRH